MKKDIGIVVGTRPEVVKMAMVYKALRNSDSLNPVLISTAQHRQMLDQALSVFDISPDYDMNLMRDNQTLSDITSKIILAWKDFYQSRKLDAVLVQGDTTTVFASAIAAFYHDIKIGHVEAGLRTYDMHSPFPEEMNRRLVSPIADFSFAPTRRALENLIAEGIDGKKCFETGNTVVDSLLFTSEKLTRNGATAGETAVKNGVPEKFAEKFIVKNRKWILATGHRRESFGTGIENICLAMRRIVEEYPDCGIIYPVHLNPKVQEPVRKLLGGNPNISLINPLGYVDFVCLMKNCRFILSDSGGVQEEAPSLGKPVLVTRNTTERPEGIEAGTCVLVGTDGDSIFDNASVLLEDDAEYNRRASLKNPYGDGHASERIRSILERELA